MTYNLGMKLGAKELRVKKPGVGEMAGVARNPIYIVLDDVMDTYNVGAIIRLADAVAAREVILCGKTEFPPNTRIHKAAVGTEAWVAWRYFADAKTAITKLQETNPKLKVMAVEQDSRSASISNFKFQISNLQPVAVVVGHETEGVSKEVLELADMIVEIPMWGVNKSLNVVVATAVMAYKLLK